MAPYWACHAQGQDASAHYTRAGMCSTGRTTLNPRAFVSSHAMTQTPQPQHFSESTWALTFFDFLAPLPEP